MVELCQEFGSPLTRGSYGNHLGPATPGGQVGSCWVAPAGVGTALRHWHGLLEGVTGLGGEFVGGSLGIGDGHGFGGDRTGEEVETIVRSGVCLGRSPRTRGNSGNRDAPSPGTRDSVTVE